MKVFNRVYSSIHLFLRILYGPLHSIINIINNNRRCMFRFAALVDTSLKQYRRPLAAKRTLVRIATQDIRFCNSQSALLLNTKPTHCKTYQDYLPPYKPSSAA